MPAHYAVSEALVVLAAAWAGWMLVRQGQRLAAGAVALFGVAALIGTVRFAGGLVEQLAPLHRLASQAGGLAGSLLLLLSLAPGAGLVLRPWIGAVLVVAVMGLAMAVPAAGPLLIVAAVAVGGAILAVPTGEPTRRIVSALAFGLMLADVTLVRSATGLGPATRWHLYHTVIALWLVLLPFCLSRPASSD